MPGGTGLELQQTLAGAVHKIPIIFITGHGADGGLTGGP
jgi:FixJ family two-component response regulator